MSGGHFDYYQYRITNIADEIQNLIDENDSRDRPYSPETIKEFTTALNLLRRAFIYVERIDYLVECDDGEETFHKRLNEEITKLGKE